MRVAEYVPGQLLVLEVASRSRSGQVTHFLSIVGETEVFCSCEGFSFRGRCHHVEDAEDLIGRVVP